MLELKKVAVTGHLSSGKSSVCQKFKDLGAYVLSADTIVHQLLSPGTEIGQRVIELFGDEVVVDGQIDRSTLAKKVFSDYRKLHLLEALLHPAVNKEIDTHFHRISKGENYSLFVVEIPLLYESKSEEFYEVVIAVMTDEKLCCRRFCEQTGKTEEEYFLRAKRLFSLDEKAKRADYVILNNGTFKDLMEKTEEVFKELR